MDMSFKPPKDLVPPMQRSWAERIFRAQAVRKGGIVRRAKKDVDKRIGADALELMVREMGFHLLECGDQYIVICNKGKLRVHT